MISFWLSYESLQHLPTFQKSSICVCERVCMHMYTYICTLCMSITCVSLIKACWLLSLSSLFQCSGLVPRHKIPLIRPLLSPGEISTRTSLDREQQSSYQLVVVVQDGGSPPRSATGTAFITVLDDNDNDPAFTHSQSSKTLIIQVMPQDQKYRHNTDRQKMKFLTSDIYLFF